MHSPEHLRRSERLVIRDTRDGAIGTGRCLWESTGVSAILTAKQIDYRGQADGPFPGIDLGDITNRFAASSTQHEIVFYQVRDWWRAIWLVRLEALLENDAA